MICPKCGSDNKDFYRFCAKCGARLEQNEIPGVTSPVREEMSAVSYGDFENEKTVILHDDVFFENEETVIIPDDDFLDDEKTVIISDDDFFDDEKTVIIPDDETFDEEKPVTPEAVYALEDEGTADYPDEDDFADEPTVVLEADDIPDYDYRGNVPVYRDNSCYRRNDTGGNQDMSYIEHLRALKGLLDDGIITEDEFTRKKQQILGI